MKRFLANFDSEERFNLFIGDYFNKVSGYPTREDIAKNVLSDIIQSKNYIPKTNSYSEIIQTYVDYVIDSRRNLLKKIYDSYNKANGKNIDIYSAMIKNRLFKNILSINYDNLIEQTLQNNIIKITPVDKTSNGDGKKFYKIFGDVNGVTSFISSQDIRKLKNLSFYSSFFQEIRENFVQYPTILMGVNLEDEDMVDILEYIIQPLSTHKTIYVIPYGTITDNKTVSFLNRNNIKLLDLNIDDVIEYLKENFRQEGEYTQKKFIW